MKKYVFLISFTLALFSTSSVATNAPANVSKSFVEQGKHILENLSNTKNQGSGFDYWPDGGIRIAYHHLRTFMSYKDIVKLSPVPVFLNNHHTKLSLDLKSNNAFGHYNPAFLKWMQHKLTAILESPQFIKGTQAQFDKYLAKTALVYWDTYLALEKWPAERDAILKDYKDKIQQGKLPESYYYNLAWSDGKKYESMTYLRDKHNSNVVAPAVYFWLRRKMDSTDTKMKGLLAQLLKAYGKIK